jgi:hypothetical protein
VHIRFIPVLVTLLALFLLAPAASAQVVTIDFGTAITPLPYVEDGFTVESLSGGGIIGSDGSNGYLTGGTNAVPIRWRISSPQSFDLVSLDVLSYFRNWRIEAMGSETASITSAGTVHFASLSGWKGISSFEIIHDPGEANGTARIDNIVIAIPEPAAGILLLPALALLRRNRR